MFLLSDIQSFLFSIYPNKGKTGHYCHYRGIIYYTSLSHWQVFWSQEPMTKVTGLCLTSRGFKNE